MALSYDTQCHLFSQVLHHLEISNNVDGYEAFLHEDLLHMVETAYNEFSTYLQGYELRYETTNIRLVHEHETTAHLVSRNESATCGIIGDVHYQVYEVDPVTRTRQSKVHEEKQLHVHLFSLPLVLGTSLSPDNTHTMANGFSLVRGLLHMFVGVHRQAQNRIHYYRQLVNKKTQRETVKFTLEFRAENPHSRYRSTNTMFLTLLDPDSRFVHVEDTWCMQLFVSWMTKPLPLALLIRAMGYTYQEFTTMFEFMGGTLEKYKPFFRKLEDQLHLYSSTEQAQILYGSEYLPGSHSAQPQEKSIHLANQHIRTTLLSHLPQEDTHHEKIAYLAYMVWRLLQFREGTFQETVLDSIDNLELQDAAMIMGNVLRQKIRSYIKQRIKYLRKTLFKNNMDFTSNRCRIEDIFNDKLTHLLTVFVNTGTISEQRTGVTQMVDTTNVLTCLAYKRKSISNLKGKDGSKADSRMVYAAHRGNICPLDTPSGADCGHVNVRALTSRVTLQQPMTHMWWIIQDELGDDWVSFEEKRNHPTQYPHHQTLVLDGDAHLKGFIIDPYRTVSRLREMKRKRIIQPSVSIFVHNQSGELWISTRGGRYVHPLLYVPHLTKFTEHQLKQMSYRDMIYHHLLEYVDSAEILHMRRRGNILEYPSHIQTYPHAEYMLLSHAYLQGISATTTPFANQSTGLRESYQSQMARQRISIPPPLHNNQSHALFYPELPLVDTYVSQELNLSHRCPSNNVIVAIHTARNAVEDGTVVNRNSIRRHLFASYHEQVYQIERGTKKQNVSQFCRPPDNTLSLKTTDMKYLKENGMPRIGSIVKQNDPVIGSIISNFATEVERSKSAKQHVHMDHLPKEYTKQPRDNSKVCKQLSGVVTSVVEHDHVRKTAVRELNVAEIGDKTASRYAQKGVISEIIPAHHMPYMRDTGVIPDIIFCVEGIPSRMTGGLQNEIIAGKLAATIGKRLFDLQVCDQEVQAAFLQEIQKQLQDHDMNPDGTDFMVDAVTGFEIPTPIMIGVLNYQRLIHMVMKKAGARATGRLNEKTRQATTGRSKGGGQCNGYMELQAMGSHGSAAFIRERNVLQSDPDHEFAWCTKCGHIAIHNSLTYIRYCRNCQTDAHVKTEVRPYSYTILYHYLAAMGIRMTLTNTPLNE
jgi:DNA-directed RNA polymerase beta subunit